MGGKSELTVMMGEGIAAGSWSKKLADYIFSQIWEVKNTGKNEARL